MGSLSLHFVDKNHSIPLNVQTKDFNVCCFVDVFSGFILLMIYMCNPHIPFKSTILCVMAQLPWDSPFKAIKY